MGVKILIRDAARLLGVSEKTIYRWIDDRELPVHRVHGQHRFNRAELLEWATRNGVRVSAELFPEPPEAEEPVPTLESALATGGIHFVKGGADRETVLREVVRVLNLPEEVDRDFFYEVLLARENLGSTAVGDGIAIPHVRNPILLHVRSAVALCFLEKPIPFGALDGNPVEILFVIVRRPAARTSSCSRGSPRRCTTTRSAGCSANAGQTQSWRHSTVSRRASRGLSRAPSRHESARRGVARLARLGTRSVRGRAPASPVGRARQRRRPARSAAGCGARGPRPDGRRESARRAPLEPAGRLDLARARCALRLLPGSGAGALGARGTLRPRVPLRSRRSPAGGVELALLQRSVRRHDDRDPGAQRDPVPRRLGDDVALRLRSGELRARARRGAPRRLGLSGRVARRNGRAPGAVRAAGGSVRRALRCGAGGAIEHSARSRFRGLRGEGRDRAAPRLASGGARRCAFSRFRGHVGRDGEARVLRIAAGRAGRRRSHARVRSRARGIRTRRCAARSLARALAARHEARAGALERREPRADRAGARHRSRRDGAR